eukprot:NODE_5915_length_543_cov_70.390688_g5168_i0.p1 GENE.NODE_5915_length_543_cov_70.390688_g5168_i0~~NODE_5915_length_543_cov_70.390688_g5168_i0.p1  ORF type:complete len:78 (-),score=8.41 NODE_5915_length_543_cov_70.390688_g5168_i0:310-513(-)
MLKLVITVLLLSQVFTLPSTLSYEICKDSHDSEIEIQKIYVSESPMKIGHTVFIGVYGKARRDGHVR